MFGTRYLSTPNSQMWLICLASIGLLCSLAAADCPERCDCRSPEIYCSRAHLSAFPTGLDNDTTFLDVGHNNITSIDDDVFVNLGLPLLAVLVADNNSISVVEPNAFRGLQDLRFLHLSGNRLTSLPKNLFCHNPAIMHIDLTGNALILPSTGPFLSAKSLEWLDLDYCHLTELPMSVFEDLPKLRYLNLNNNSLQYVNGTALRKFTYLRYFKMAGNPLHCDCTLKPLWMWLYQHNIRVEATCQSPEDQHEKPWSVVKDISC